MISDAACAVEKTSDFAHKGHAVFSVRKAFEGRGMTPNDWILLCSIAAMLITHGLIMDKRFRRIDERLGQIGEKIDARG